MLIEPPGTNGGAEMHNLGRLVVFVVGLIALMVGATNAAVVHEPDINVAGTVTVTGGTESVTPSSLTATFTDGADPPTSNFSGSISWGDNTTTNFTSADVSGSGGSYTVSATHQYAEEGTFNVSVTINDSSGNSVTESGTATVADATLTGGAPVSISSTAGIAFTTSVATFADADTTSAASDFTANINWGDSTPLATGTVTGSNGNFTVSGTHTYASAGPFSVVVNVTDVGGSTAMITSSATISKDGSTTTLMSSSNPSLFGQAVTFTATVAGAGATSLTPTGSVKFTVDSVPMNPVPLSNGMAALQLSSLGGGPHTVSAAYSGDQAFNASSTASPLSQTVNASGTTVTVSGSPNTSVFGQSVTFTGTVHSTAPGTPTGTITFIDGSTSLGVVTLSNGSATFTTSNLVAANHSITAQYSGDANFTAAAGSVAQSVTQAHTASALTLSTASVSAGAAVKLTAVVTAQSPSAGTPSGNVTFNDGSTVLGSATLDATGTATFTTTALAPGTHTLVAAYNGNANFMSSTSASQSLALVAPISLNASATQGTVVAGQSFTFHFVFTATDIDSRFGSTVTFAASGLPPGAAATFNPPFITLPKSGDFSTNVTMTVTTSSTALLPTSTTLMAGLFILVALGPMRCTPLLARRWTMVAAIVMLCALVGCGGGASNNVTTNPSQGTGAARTPSTSDITVTATSGTVTSTQNFQLTVQ